MGWRALQLDGSKGSQWVVSECEKLSKLHGPRFDAGNLLSDLAKTDQTFYEKYAEITN